MNIVKQDSVRSRGGINTVATKSTEILHESGSPTEELYQQWLRFY